VPTAWQFFIKPPISKLPDSLSAPAGGPCATANPSLPTIHQPTTNMKLLHVTGLVAITCGLLASCYPYKENPRKKKPRKPQTEQTTLTAEEKAKQEQAAAAKKAEEEAKKKAEEAKQQAGNVIPNPAPNPGQPKPAPNLGEATQGAPENISPPPQPKPRSEYVYANKVPGREGFVFSPYNNKVIDVRGYTSGQLVMDPTYPPSEKKYFRVP
jgi:hypothetical protein